MCPVVSCVIQCRMLQAFNRQITFYVRYYGIPSGPRLGAVEGSLNISASMGHFDGPLLMAHFDTRYCFDGHLDEESL